MSSWIAENRSIHSLETNRYSSFLPGKAKKQGKGLTFPSHCLTAGTSVVDDEADTTSTSESNLPVNKLAN